ncbi:hypothetical protein EV368DRAFT_79657 [Lentinula lateritia]|nr:hypothetical protein EV368DRAFT_79657 [Lentinula lateritia]
MVGFPHRIVTPLSCPEILDECLSHLEETELAACAQVCLSWREPAKALIFETIDLRKDGQKLDELQDNPFRLRYVRRIIVNIHFSFTQLVTTPMRVKTLEFRIRHSLLEIGPEYINETISAFCPNLETFTIGDAVPLLYSSFSVVLNTLGKCKNLRNLTLPAPAIPEYHRDCTEDGAFFQLAPITDIRPQLRFLQLVSTEDRDNPQIRTVASRMPFKASEYSWLEEPTCPFDVRTLRVLVIGSPAATQIILPLVSHSLCRLEVCQAFDQLSSWTQYAKYQASPIQLLSLRHLVLAFHLLPSKWLLDIIRTPNIETITIKWTTGVPYSCYEERLRQMDGQISRLDASHVFPPHLKRIVFITASSPPDAHWGLQIFPLSSLFGTIISHQEFIRRSTKNWKESGMRFLRPLRGTEYFLFQGIFKEVVKESYDYLLDIDQSEVQSAQEESRASANNVDEAASPTLIHQIPPELLLKIFRIHIFHHSGKDTPWAGYSLQIYCPPVSRRLHVQCRALVLAGACSRWREIVLAEHIFWSTFYLDIEVFRDRPQLLPLLDTYTSNSRSVPLSLSISLDNTMNMDNTVHTTVNNNIKQVLKILLEHAKRWRSLKFTAADETYIRHLNEWCSLDCLVSSGYSKTQLSDVVFLSLEDLQVEYLHPGHDRFSLFQASPRLKKYSVNFMSCRPKLALPDLSHLEELHVIEGFLEGPSIGYFLSQMPLLRDCTIEGFLSTHDDLNSDFSEYEPPNSSYTSTLSSLKVSTCTFRPHAWKNLCLPNLTSLEIYHPPVSSTRRTDVSQYSDFISMLISASSLQTLSLVALSEPMASDLLAACPPITNLRLRIDDSEGMEHFKQTTLGLSRTSIAPKLSSLTVHLMVYGFRRMGSQSDSHSVQEQLVDVLCSLVEPRTFPFLRHFTLNAVHFGNHDQHFWSRLRLTGRLKALKVINNSTSTLRAEDGNHIVVSDIIVSNMGNLY